MSISLTVIHRIINRLLDIMLPNHLLDLSVPNQKNSIKEKLVRDAERQKRQEALLWAVNVSTLIDYTDLDNKAGMLFTVREHRRGIQEQQKDLVIFTNIIVYALLHNYMLFQLPCIHNFFLMLLIGAGVLSSDTAYIKKNTKCYP